jgi:hypothetical protein
MPENLRTFDPQAVSLTWSNRHWQIVAGESVLKDFGPRETEARQALRLIRELHLNQYGSVGAQAPVMEYWLADGGAPHAPLSGVRTLALVPSALRVEQVNGQWCLRDSQRVLFNFGARADEARLALAIMRKYGFAQVGVVGQGAPLMQVFLGAATAGNDSAQPASIAFNTSPARQTAARFSRQSRPPEFTQKPGAQPTPPAADLAALSPAVPKLQPPPGPPADKRPAQPWREDPGFINRHAAPAKVSAGAERVAFDWSRVELRQDNGEWKLAAGQTILARFGGDEYEGRRALTVLRHYRFSEQWRVGSEAEHFSYFLANGQAPRGLTLGLSGISFHPETVTVKQVGDRYCLCSPEQVLVRLGTRADEARGLLDVVKRNRFDRLCRLGADGDKGMTFLVRSH